MKIQSGDEVINIEDEDPFDPCVPNAPPLSENVIGEWVWSSFGESRRLEILEDGTYIEFQNAIISNGTIAERTWSIENVSRLIMQVKNSDGFTARLTLKSKSIACDDMVFEGLFEDVIFTRQ